MAPGCPPCPPKVNTGNKTAGSSPWPSAKDHSCHCCPGLVGVSPAGPHPQPRVFLLQGGEVGLGGRSGPSATLWPSGTQGRVGRGCGSARRLALLPQPAAVGGIHNDGSVYRWPWSQREGALPPGRSSRQTVVHGLKGPSSQPLWAASPAPGRRGAWGTFFPSHCLPTMRRGSCPLYVPREAARPSPSSGDFHESEVDVRTTSVS